MYNNVQLHIFTVLTHPSSTALFVNGPMKGTQPIPAGLTRQGYNIGQVRPIWHHYSHIPQTQVFGLWEEDVTLFINICFK